MARHSDGFGVIQNKKGQSSACAWPELGQAERSSPTWVMGKVLEPSGVPISRELDAPTPVLQEGQA